ncbi:transmembrane protein 54-like isoform 2-T2 [Spinachia spinachia]
MKMGLCMLLLGHVNFLLGALMHGVVLRHVSIDKQAGATEYSIANVVAIASGLVGIVGGILAIVLSKNQKSRGLTWSLLSVGLAAALMAAASTVGLTVSAVSAVVWGGQNLLTHCRLPDAIGGFITDKCPFDPTRVYSTTLILWVPLILTCVVQMVFSARCFAVCVSFLGLTCCRNRKTTGDSRQALNVVRPMEETAPSRPTEAPTRHTEITRSYAESPTRSSEAPTRHAPRSLSQPLRCHSEPLSSHRDPPWQNTEPPRRQHKPAPLPHQPRSLPPLERRPLRQPDAGSPQRAPEPHRLLQRATLERSSFWI